MHCVLFCTEFYFVLRFYHPASNCNYPNSLTLWHRSNFHNLIASHVLKKLSKFYVTSIYITSFITTTFSHYTKTANTLLSSSQTIPLLSSSGERNDNFKRTHLVSTCRSINVMFILVTERKISSFHVFARWLSNVIH